MNKRKRKSLLFVFVLTLILFPGIVSAKTTASDNQVCVGNMLYTITDAGKNVQMSHITQKDIDNSCYGYRKKNCPKENKFQAISQGISCAITGGSIGSDNYEFSTCPLASTKEQVDSMTEVNDSLTQTWVASRNQWKITITFKKGGYKAKLVPKQATTNAKESPYRENCIYTNIEGDCEQYDFPGNNWINISNNVLEFYVNPGDTYFLAFYLNVGSGDACNGAYMGYIQGAGSSNVDNPIYNNPKCVAYRQEMENNSALGVATSLVRECYDQKIDFSLISQYTDAKIQADIDHAKNIFSQLSTGTVSGNLSCSFDKNKNSNVASGSETANSYTRFLEEVGGTYWKALCTETLVISYEQPKGVSAGQGFSYSPTIKMERTCTPIEIKKPQMKDKCSYSVECWGGPANHSGEPGAGPSTDFDQCVQTCDGGAYSQACINKCYQENYSNGKVNTVESPLYSKAGLYDDNYQVIQVGRQQVDSSKTCSEILKKPYGQTRLPLSSCLVTTSNASSDCWDGTTCRSEHGVIFTYLDGCNSGNNPTKCYEVYTSSTNCADDPIQDYKDQVAASLAELEAVNTAISEYSSSENLKNEEFSASILDSHTGKTQEYKNATDAQVQVTIKQVGNKDYTSEIIDSKTEQIGNTSVRGETVTVNSYKVTRELKLQLDYGYVSKTTAFDTIYGKHYFDTHASIQKNYYPGENKYFTNLNARGINLYEKWPTLIGFDNEEAIDENNENLVKNIKYNFRNLGTWSQWSNIDLDCFYGIKACSGITIPQNETCPNSGNNNDIPGTGITFIYRPIDLSSPFVERDPRWNWSSNAINNKYNVNPTETLQNIMDKGYDIYRTSNQSSDVERSNNDLDYEIVLTKQNINAIRQYNKEKGGEYLNYDMYCYTKDGANVCRSSFLGSENASNDTYMKILKRGLIGCNNQASPDTCERTYADVRGKGAN